MRTIAGWAEYSNVLEAATIFITWLKAWVGRWRTVEGTGASKMTHIAVAMGSEYIWTRRGYGQSASLLWRTEYDRIRMEGFSGSVLCLGRPSDLAVKAVLFQDYEIPVKLDRLHQVYRPVDEDD